MSKNIIINIKTKYSCGTAVNMNDKLREEYDIK